MKVACYTFLCMLHFQLFQVYMCVQQIIRLICLTIENVSEINMNTFRNKIADAAKYSKLDPSLNVDPNVNYEILSRILCDAKTNYIPGKSKKTQQTKR